MVGRSFLMVSGLSGTLRDSAPQPGPLVLPQRCVSDVAAAEMEGATSDVLAGYK